MPTTNGREQPFNEGIKNNDSRPADTTADFLATVNGTDGTYGKIDPVNLPISEATQVAIDILEISKQDTLVSGTNIKTLNGNSLLGLGDLIIGGSGLVAKTGSTMVFTENAIYNQNSPVSTTFTIDITGIISGCVCAMYHKSSSFPTIILPNGVSVAFNSEDYIADNKTVNVMYFLAMPGNNFVLTTKQYTNGVINNNAEIQEIITNATSAGDEMPPNVTLYKLNVFVNALKNIRNDADTSTDNLLNYIDLLEVYVSSQREFAKYNIITGVKITSDVNGVPIFNSSGFKSANSTNYFTVGGNIKSTVAKMTLNDASLYVYQNGATTTGYMCGVIDSVDNTKRILIGKNSNNIDALLALNGNQVTVTPLSTPDGGILIDRNISTEFKVYHNGILANTVTSNSIDIPNNPMGVCGRNFASTPNPQDCIVSLIMYGKSIRDFQSNFNQLVKNLM